MMGGSTEDSITAQLADLRIVFALAKFRFSHDAAQLPQPHFHATSLISLILIYEPHHAKTSNVVSNKVRHKLSCTITEDG